MNITTTRSLPENEGMMRLCIVLLVGSALVGAGIGYGKLYLYHLVLPFVAFITWRGLGVSALRDRLIVLRLPLGFVVVTLVWYGLGVIWAADKGAVVQYFLIMSLCYACTVLLLILVDSPGRFRLLLFTIGVVVGVEALIGVFEVFMDFRWPISRFSWHAPLFGRTNDLAELLTTPRATAYINSSPTGFHWNPNHLATLLAIVFPFALVLPPRAWAWLFAAVCLLLVAAGGARLAYLAMLLMALLMVIAAPRRSLVPGAFLIGVMLFFTIGAAIPGSKNEKFHEFAALTPHINGFISADDGEDIPQDETSTGKRRHASELCLQSVIETRGLGLGGGNTRWYLPSRWTQDGEPLSDAHNWWVEVLSEAGVPYTLLYIAAWALIWTGAVRRWFRERGTWMGAVSFALAVALVGLVPAGISPSSMVYFLPLYILFAVGVLVALPYALHADPETR